MIETSILIPTKNGAQDFAACLEGIYSQKGTGPFEVIMIDSGSTDGTLEIAQRYPVRLERIPPEAFHHARTRNYAASLAAGEFLVFLSQDAMPTSDTWLQALVSDFDDPSVGAVYGRQLPKPGSSIERQDALSEVYGTERLIKDLNSREKLGFRYYHFSSVNAGIRRSVWESTGFPEELKVFEDLGIAKKILEAGHKIVYEPQASVYHSHNHTTMGLFKRYFDIGVTFNRLGIWNDRTRSSMLQSVRQLLRRKITRVKSDRSRHNVSKSIRQDLAKSAGFFLGLNERFLPLILKRRSSAFHLFD